MPNFNVRFDDGATGKVIAASMERAIRVCAEHYPDKQVTAIGYAQDQTVNPAWAIEIEFDKIEQDKSAWAKTSFDTACVINKAMRPGSTS